MNAIEASVLVTAVLSLVAIFSFAKYRRSAVVRLGKLSIDASNETPPAIRATDISSRKGGVTLEDKTGRGAELERASVDGEIRITTESQHPKA